jgi:hypothetical protein
MTTTWARRMAGASRMVNAIPAVYEAPPGLLSAPDLPLVTGARLVRSAPGPSRYRQCFSPHRPSVQPTSLGG